MAVYTVDAALTASDPANNQFKTIQEAIDAARGLTRNLKLIGLRLKSKLLLLNILV